jgi:hypothetical protein
MVAVVSEMRPLTPTFGSHRSLEITVKANVMLLLTTLMFVTLDNLILMAGLPI